MKNKYPTITLFGSNSGNNVGDAAILSAIVVKLSNELPGCHFYTPTTNPAFVNNNYGKKYNIQALNIMPWNLAFRFLGVPSIRCLAKSDVALICDGIIFGKRLFNPAFNLLITLAPLALVTRLLGCKLACYCVGIGPFPNGRGKGLARFLLQRCDLILMRDSDSKAQAEALGVTRPIELVGDAAYLNPVSTRSRGGEIATSYGIDLDRPLLGINITSYVDSWVREGATTVSLDSLLNALRGGILTAKAKCEGNFQCIVFSTHPMDEVVAAQLATALDAPVISNRQYLSHDMQAVMGLCSLFLGMRFHSLVLASAVGVPVVGLVYAPKVAGLMRDLQSQEYSISLTGLCAESLAQILTEAWGERDSLAARQQAVVARFKQGVELAAKRVKDTFFKDESPGAC